MWRNRAYSGDGGLDGRYWHPRTRFASAGVQVKRYGASIQPAHVRAFAALAADRRCREALFVHCGRTGPGSYGALRGSNVYLVSGDAIVDLLLGGGGSLVARPLRAPAPIPPPPSRSE